MMMWLVTKTLKATSRWSWNKTTITRISTSSSHLTIVYPVLQCKSRVSLKFVYKKWQKYLVICVHYTPSPFSYNHNVWKWGGGTNFNVVCPTNVHYQMDKWDYCTLINSHWDCTEFSIRKTCTPLVTKIGRGVYTVE